MSFFGEAVFEKLDELAERKAKSAADFPHFQKIKTTFAYFILAYPGLRDADFLCQVNLTKARVYSDFLE